jgi:hypothetical protein
MNGTEEEAEEYLKILETHENLYVTNETIDNPIPLPQTSWNRILQLIQEDKKYSISYICFSSTNEIEENDIWSIKRKPENEEEVELKEVFFNTMLEPATPHDIPFDMSDDDFNIFNDYFNQKETKPSKLKLTKHDDGKKGKMGVTDYKEEIPNVKYDTTEKIESDNGIEKIITTKKAVQFEKKIVPVVPKEKKKIEEKPKYRKYEKIDDKKQIGKPLEIQRPIENKYARKIQEEKDVRDRDRAEDIPIDYNLIGKDKKKLLGKTMKLKYEKGPNEEDVKVLISKYGHPINTTIPTEQNNVQDDKEIEEGGPKENIVYNVIKDGKMEQIKDMPDNNIIYRTLVRDDKIDPITGKVSPTITIKLGAHENIPKKADEQIQEEKEITETKDKIPETVTQ